MQKKLFLITCALSLPLLPSLAKADADSFTSFFDAFEGLMSQQRELFQKTFDQMNEDWNSQMGKFQKEQMRLKIDDQDNQTTITVEDIQLAEDGKELPVAADVMYAHKDEADQVKIQAGQSKINIRYQDSFLDATVNMRALANNQESPDHDQKEDLKRAKKIYRLGTTHFSTRKATTIIGSLDIEKVNVEADYKNNKIIIHIPKIETAKSYRKIAVTSVR